MFLKESLFLKRLLISESGHNIKFSSYCGVCIQNEIRMFLRKEKIKCKRCISIDDYVRTDDNESEVTGMDILCDINDDFVYDYEYKELCSLVRKYVYDLESPIKEAVIMSFGFDNQERLSQADIAKILNRDQSSVSRMIDKALMQISKKLILCGAIEDNKRNILNKSKKLK